MNRLGLWSLLCVNILQAAGDHIQIYEEERFELPPAYPGSAAYIPCATPSDDELPPYEAVVARPAYLPPVTNRLPAYTAVADIVIPNDTQELTLKERVYNFFTRLSNRIQPTRPVVVGLEPSVLTALTDSLVLFNRNYSDLMSQLNALRNNPTLTYDDSRLVALQPVANLAQLIEDTMEDLHAVQFLLDDVTNNPEHGQKLQQFGQLTVGQIAAMLERGVDVRQAAKKLADIQPTSVAALLTLIASAPEVYLPHITPDSSMKDIFVRATMQGISAADMQPTVVVLQRVGSSDNKSFQASVRAVLQGKPVVIDEPTATFMQVYQNTVHNPAGGRPKTKKFIDSYSSLITGPATYACSKPRSVKNVVSKL